MPDKEPMPNRVIYDLDEILHFIVKYKRQNDGNSPSLREIMSAIGSNSTSTVRYNLLKLQDQGRITYPNGIGYNRHIHVKGLSPMISITPSFVRTLTGGRWDWRL